MVQIESKTDMMEMKKSLFCDKVDKLVLMDANDERYPELKEDVEVLHRSVNDLSEELDERFRYFNFLEEKFSHQIKKLESLEYKIEVQQNAPKLVLEKNSRQN